MNIDVENLSCVLTQTEDNSVLVFSTHLTKEQLKDALLTLGQKFSTLTPLSCSRYRLMEDKHGSKLDPDFEDHWTEILIGERKSPQMTTSPDEFEIRMKLA